MSLKEKDIKPLLIGTELPNSRAYNPHKKRRYICFIMAVIIVLIGIVIVIEVMYNTFSSLFKNDNESHDYPGVYGKFPTYGGGIKNQQIVPGHVRLLITKDNVFDMKKQCIYTSNGGSSYVGYIAIDDDNYAYFTDRSGYVTKIELNNCTEIWRVYIATVLGYNYNITKLISRNSVTLFRDSNGTKAVLLATPQGGGTPDYSDGCFAVALYANNGSLYWKLRISNANEPWVRCHGLMIDDHFGYGGITGVRGKKEVSRGAFVKIDIDIPALVDIWYSIPDGLINYNDTNERLLYRGAGMWNFPAIIGKYVVVGTGNLYSYPSYIENCLLGNFSELPLNRSYHLNPCNQNMSFNKWWRCLEKDVYPDSFVIFNKDDNENKLIFEKAIPLQGVDAENHNNCRGKYTHQELEQRECVKVVGPDADLAAVATFKNEKRLYGAALQKSGHFYVFDIPSGDVKIAKKIGPATYGGGGTWSIAVDEENMIAIASITGGVPDGGYYYTQYLLSGSVICGRVGTVHAIDLHTGNILWQIANPFGLIIDNCNNQTKWNNIVHTIYYTSWEQTCERDMNGNAFENEYLSNEYVHVPPIIDDIDKMPFNAVNRGMFIAPITIANDMVFIGSLTGDVFIHNVFDGKYIHTLQCPTYYHTTYHIYHRAAIKGGITVFDDYVVFYCGGSDWLGVGSEGNQVISMKLN
eukprot:542748_1